jgi:drug/metabolite transporter (DMT)-like permease
MQAAPVQAAVNVERHGAENPMVEISRSILYGGLAGLAVGGAVAIVSDGDDTTPIKWGLFTGVVAGAAMGFYWVFSRPQPTAPLELAPGRATLELPTPTLAPDGAAHVHLVAYRF